MEEDILGLICRRTHSTTISLTVDPTRNYREGEGEASQLTRVQSVHLGVEKPEPKPKSLDTKMLLPHHTYSERWKA